MNSMKKHRKINRVKIMNIIVYGTYAIKVIIFQINYKTNAFKNSLKGKKTKSSFARLMLIFFI